MSEHLLPNLVIIGAQKSASTFAQQIIADHPEVSMPGSEETYFEDPDFHERPLSELTRRFEGTTEKVRGIKRPNYIGKAEVPGRIAKILPESKLIAVLRNPVDRAIAAYLHQVRFGTSPLMRLDAVMRELVEGAGELPGYKRSREILEFGKYHKYLSMYRTYLETGRLLVLLHDDILRDPRGCIRTCYQFLEVDPSFEPPSLHSRPMAAVNNPLRIKVLAARNPLMFVYDPDRTRLYPRKMNVLQYTLAGGLTVLDRYILAPILPNAKPRLSLDVRKKVLEF